MLLQMNLLPCPSTMKVLQNALMCLKCQILVAKNCVGNSRFGFINLLRVMAVMVVRQNQPQ